jgi:predicted metalloendopeptidase
MRFRVSLAALAVVSFLAAGAAYAQTIPGRGYMDDTCAPCKDFFRYCNGAWADTVQIPAAYTGIGSGRELFDRNQLAQRRVLDRAAANVASESDPTLKKLGILYSVLNDSARADSKGAAAIHEALDRIAAVKSKADLSTTFGWLATRALGLGQLATPGFGIPFYFDNEVDPHQVTLQIGRLQQGGLGLPDRDFYFRTDPKSVALRTEYVAHLGRLLGMLGDDPSTTEATAQNIMKLETALAESCMTLVAQRDPHAIYHKMSVQQLARLCPSIDWVAYFREVGVPSLASPSATLDVSMPGYFAGLDAQLRQVPIETWRAYLRVHYTRRTSAWLGKAFFDEGFRFGSQLTGAKSPDPQWKRAAVQCDDAMGDALGKAFVATEFPPSSKARVLELVNNLQAVFKERIETRAWMSAATKKQALTKLAAIDKKIGYPDKWRDYSSLELDPALSAAENLMRCQRFNLAIVLGKIGKPVDRTEWGLTAPTVNAYYNPTRNEIVFPAGILQPPYFDPAADDASNYGAIGMVIGHEMTHGFDDEGRQYDATGALRDWWTPEDGKKFEVAAKRVADQFDGYIGVDTLHVNGKLTLGENIADFGGATIAFHAYERSLGGKRAPVVNGFTGEQRFFLGTGHAWRSKYRPEILRTVVLTNPHSPPYWRVIGPLSNMPEFRAAFSCKEGDPMVRPDSVRPEIW